MSLVQQVSTCKLSTISGLFLRHTAVKIEALSGSRAGGRWGPPDAFPVLYLGRPVDSVTVEAYRHLVDPTEGLTGAMVGPRRIWTCEVAVTSVLDLRDPRNRMALGLEDVHLTSSPQNYDECNAVAVAAHQLELHGIIAPAATGLGETLALFDLHIPIDEYPQWCTAKFGTLFHPIRDDPSKLSASGRRSR